MAINRTVNYNESRSNLFTYIKKTHVQKDEILLFVYWIASKQCKCMPLTLLRFNIELHELFHDLWRYTRVTLDNFEQDLTPRPRVTVVARRRKQAFERLEISPSRFHVHVTVSDTTALDDENQCLHVLCVRERWQRYCGWRHRVAVLEESIKANKSLTQYLTTIYTAQQYYSCKK